MRRVRRLAALGTATAAIALIGFTSAAVPADGGTEKRCGILQNPTPGNWWLIDRDGEWTIGVQMGYQAEGLETLPESFYEDGWVRTNGYYGYRCACLNVATDRKTMRIVRIFSGEPLPMTRCEADKAIDRED